MGSPFEDRFTAASAPRLMAWHGDDVVIDPQGRALVVSAIRIPRPKIQSWPRAVLQLEVGTASYIERGSIIRFGQNEDWRIMDENDPEVGLRQFTIHPVLPTRAKIVGMAFAKSATTGVEVPGFSQIKALEHRVLFLPFDGVEQERSRQKRIEALNRVYMEDSYPFKHGEIIVLDDNSAWRVIEWQEAEARELFFYAVVERFVTKAS